MSNSEYIDRIIKSKQFSNLYSNLNLSNTVQEQRSRYLKLHNEFINRFGEKRYSIFSAPGRTELSGNHTDHNNGMVLAAAVDRDAVCFTAPSDDNMVRLYDLRYEELISVDLEITGPLKEEENTCQSLIRGIAARLAETGWQTGGFYGCLHSEVLSGSGLSSSAALEVLLATVFNYFFNNKAIESLEIARIAQYAENRYFGKPCGLMDQTASACGGTIFIDFNNPEQPVVEKAGDPFNQSEYAFAVISPGGDHAGLTHLYSAIPVEMQQVSNLLGKEKCRGLSINDLSSNIDRIRKQCGDRSYLRVLHFITENIRVTNQFAALKAGAIERFLELVNESGNSSWKYLQNVSNPKDPQHQDLAVALAWAEQFIKENGGACRVHGGGFAGTILVFCKKSQFSRLKEYMDGLFGSNATIALSVREAGPVCLSSNFKYGLVSPDKTSPV